MTAKPLRKFWKSVAVIEAEGGFGIALDGKPVRAPSKRPLVVAARPLAEAAAEEWQTPGETLNPLLMPLTRLANTAFDRVIPARDAIIEELLAYVDSDVLCYRTADQPALAERQQAVWQPILDWAEGVLGVRWQVTGGLMPIVQDASIHAAMRQALENLDDLSLTAHQAAAPVLGSLVLGLALIHGRVTAEEAFAAAYLDELWQAEKWGEDYEAIDRRDGLRSDLGHTERFLRLIRA